MDSGSNRCAHALRAASHPSCGRIARFFTDICADKGWPRLLHLIPPKLRPYAVARLLDRVPENVPISRVTAFTDLGFEYSRRLRAAKSPGDATAVFLWNDSEFCSRVIASPWGNAGAVSRSTMLTRNTETCAQPWANHRDGAIHCSPEW